MTREEFISELVKCRGDVVAYGRAVFPKYFSDDCVSEAITIALEKWHIYNETCKVSSFVIGIYKYQQLQEIDRNRFEELKCEDLFCYQVNTFDLEYIDSRIDMLTPCQRKAIERIISGKKTREIAKELNKTPSYVAFYNYSVRTKLRKLINDDYLLENHQPNAALAHNKRHTHPAA